jgi:hypothetical protein
VIVAWLLFPLVMLAVCLGCGLAIDTLAGWRLPGALILSIGLALIIVIASLTTDVSALAPLTTPLILLIALAGYLTARHRLPTLRPDPWALAPAIGIYAICAAPIVLTGQATFLGYFVLNDAVFHFSLIDRLLHHGHDLTGIPVSSYLSILRNYLSSSYPLGADLPIGVLRPLVGQDVAWLFQPYLAVIMALGGAAVHALLRDVVASRRLRAFTAFVAGQAGLLYAYYLQGSIKEIATTWLITVTVALVFATLHRGLRPRGVLALAVVALAGLDVLDLAIAPWLAPPLAAFVIAAAWRARRTVRATPPRRLALTAAAGLVVLGVLAVPIASRVSTFLRVDTAVLTAAGDLGNLVSPLPKWEMFGIWPVGDFRFPVLGHDRLTYALIGIELASAALGTIWAVRRRRFAPLLLLAGNGVAALYLLHRGSPYADAKVMMIFSLTAVTTALLGSAALADAGRRVEAWGLAAVIAAGVLWTMALGYHDASVAPRARLAELSAIGQRFSGQGPAFYNLSDEYAAYFIRTLAPVDPALSVPAPRPGATAPLGRQPWDPDILPLAYLESFRLVVIGNSALASRPPANYRLAYQGRYYDVWQRVGAPTVVDHVAFGGALYPAAVPRCSVVRATAARAARLHDRLAYVVRPPVPALVPTQAVRPPDWGLDAADPFSLIPRDQPGVMAARVRVPSPGRYRLLVSGAIGQQLDVRVDGRPVGSIADELGPPGQITPVATVPLTAGPHLISVVRPGNDLTPGDGGTSRTIGPVLLLGGPAVPPVSEIAPDAARSLCGKPLDWLEIVR